MKLLNRYAAIDEYTLDELKRKYRRSKSVWLVMLVLIAACQAQQPTAKSPAPAPSLGFNKLKDVSPIIDMDALTEENELKKKLPGNQFVGDKRAMH